MPETVTSPDPAQSFSDYLRVENEREKSGGAEPAPVVAAAASPAAPVGDAPAESVEPPAVEATDRNADGTFKPKSSSQHQRDEWKRNKDLTAQLHQARQERDALKAAQTPATPPAPTTASAPASDGDPEPELDQFLDTPDPYAALAKASGKWAARQELKAQRQHEQAHSAQSALNARIDAFVADHADYHEKLSTVADVEFDGAVLDAIFKDNDLGPAVAYHLANHPDEARRIAALKPVEGVKAIGKLEVQLGAAPLGSAPKPRSVSMAKPLIKPVSAAPIAPESPPPDDLPWGPEYIRQGNRRDRQRAEAMRGA